MTERICLMPEHRRKFSPQFKAEAMVGVEIHSRARLGLFGSAHRYISCGFTARPAAEVGT